MKPLLSQSHRTVCPTLLALLIGLHQASVSAAELIADWGTLFTPIGSEASFSFAQYDIAQNFAHQYSFSLQGGSEAYYSVAFIFDPCRNGCGNPDLSYGIYDANGSLITASNGTLLLSAGSYVFQVKGDGMGSGNSLDYQGAVNFTMAATGMVAPAPEPATWLLSLLGLAGMGYRLTRQHNPFPSLGVSAAGDAKP